MTTQITRRRVFATPAARIRLGSLVGLWRQRQQLAKLDDRSLIDSGISRSEADRESNRAFWDVPAHWRD